MSTDTPTETEQITEPIGDNLFDIGQSDTPDDISDVGAAPPSSADAPPEPTLPDPAPAPVAPVEPEPPALDAALLAEAQGWGFTPEDLQGRSDEQVRGDIARQTGAWLRSQPAVPQQQPQGFPQPPQAPQQPAPTPQPVPAGLQVPDEYLARFRADLNFHEASPDDFDAKMVEQLGGMNDARARQMAQLQYQQDILADVTARLDQHYQQAVQREQKEYDEWYGKTVKDFGPEWAEVFGPDPYSLASGTPLHTNNQSFRNMIDRMVGERGISRDQAAAQLRDAMFPEHAQKLRSKQLTDTLQTRVTTAVGRPGSGGKPVSKQTEAEWIAEQAAKFEGAK